MFVPSTNIAEKYIAWVSQRAAHKIILPSLNIVVSLSLVLLSFLLDDRHVVSVYDL